MKPEPSLWLTVLSGGSPTIAAVLMMWTVTTLSRNYDAPFLNYLKENQDPIMMALVMGALGVAAVVATTGDRLMTLAAGLQPITIHVAHSSITYQTNAGTSLLLATITAGPLLMVTWALYRDQVKKEIPMNENIQMLQKSAREYDQERRDKAQEVLGESIEDLRAFTHIALVWFQKTRESSPLGDVLASKDPEVIRLTAIHNLANTAIPTARDIPSMLAEGNNYQMVTAWRTLAEAKNNALFIHMDASGEAANRWTIFQEANAYQADPEDPYLKWMVKNARKLLKKKGESHKTPESWARAPNGKAYQGNIARCEFVWKNRKSTQLLSEEEQANMANREKRMLQEANILSHATIFHSNVGIDFCKYLQSILYSTMEIAWTYKNASNFLMGLPDDIEKDDFTTYPDEYWETRRMSRLVMEAYQHARENLEKRMKTPIKSYSDPTPRLEYTRP